MDKTTKHILLSADAADGLITKSHIKKTTVFLPKNSDHLISKHSLADTNLLRQILLCSSVEVNDHVFFFRKKNFMLVSCLTSITFDVSKKQRLNYSLVNFVSTANPIT